MRTIPLLLLTALLGIAVTALVLKANAAGKKTPCTTTKHSGGFALVELFTSEGCSSCPPADKLLEKIQQEYKNEPVYILAYHVDYWDRLGWKDVFSKPAFSERQYQYVNWLNLPSAYTPQAVVNGSKEFVGSQEPTLRNVITDDLKNAFPSPVSLQPLELSGNQVKVNYTVVDPPKGTSLFLNLVEKSAITKVLRGENKGRELSHVQVVIEQQKIKAGAGIASFLLPAGKTTKELEVIGFIQNDSNGQINGAAKSVFN